MRTNEGDCRVVVVGAGAGGTLVATHLVTALSSRFRVELVDPAPSTGRGQAYSDHRRAPPPQRPGLGHERVPARPRALPPLAAQPPRPEVPAPRLRAARGVRSLHREPADHRDRVPRQRPARTPPRRGHRHHRSGRRIRRRALRRRAARGAGRRAGHQQPSGHRVGARRSSRPTPAWSPTRGRSRSPRSATC